MPDDRVVGYINLALDSENLVIPRFVLDINGLRSDRLEMVAVPNGILLRAAKTRMEMLDEIIYSINWEESFCIYNWKALWTSARQLVIAINPSDSEDLIMIERLHADSVEAEDDRRIDETILVLEWCRENHPKTWDEDTDGQALQMLLTL